MRCVPVLWSCFFFSCWHARWRPTPSAVSLGCSPTWQVCNAIIISVARHPLWLSVVGEISQRWAAGVYDPVDLSGPRMLEAVVDKWQRSAQATSSKDGASRSSRSSPSSDGASKHRVERRNGTAAAPPSAVVVLPAVAFFPTWDPMQAKRK